MMGERIDDPAGVEGEPGGSDGLGLLPVRTVLAGVKTPARTAGVLRAGPRGGFDPVGVAGYEIHAGVTEVDEERAAGPMLMLERGVAEGCWSLDGRRAGTYLHGLFDTPGAVEALATWCRPDLGLVAEAGSALAWKQAQYDRLAEHLEEHLDVARLFGIVGLERP